jgi:hypothetical protein
MRTVYYIAAVIIGVLARVNTMYSQKILYKFFLCYNQFSK